MGSLLVASQGGRLLGSVSTAVGCSMISGGSCYIKTFSALETS